MFAGGDKLGSLGDVEFKAVKCDQNPEKAKTNDNCVTNYCWFSHDVTKFQSSELLILPRFYFHDVLEQLKTNIQTNFHSDWVLGLVIDYA